MSRAITLILMVSAATGGLFLGRAIRRQIIEPVVAQEAAPPPRVIVELSREDRALLSHIAASLRTLSDPPPALFEDLGRAWEQGRLDTARERISRDVEEDGK